MKYLWLLSRKMFFPGLHNLGAQIRCAQNWYITVQTDLKYPLGSSAKLEWYLMHFFHQEETPRHITEINDNVVLLELNHCTQ